MNIDAPVEAGPPGRGQLIAILDDSQDLLDLMQELLEEEGYDDVTMHACDGVRKKIIELRPALVILDIMLDTPDSGWQLLQTLTLDPKTKGMGILICSGATAFLREHQAQLDAFGYEALDKPFDLDALLAKVATALARTATCTIQAGNRASPDSDNS
jgi:DNA-binding response OmpR family regulator